MNIYTMYMVKFNYGHPSASSGLSLNHPSSTGNYGKNQRHGLGSSPGLSWVYIVALLKGLSSEMEGGIKLESIDSSTFKGRVA